MPIVEDILSNIKNMSFTWVPIYTELAGKILPYRTRQEELLKMLADINSSGAPTIFLDDYVSSGAKESLAEIDPFTFFASFNRNIRNEHRIAHLVALKQILGLAAAVPGDFNGIPLVDNQRSWFFAFKKDRKPDDLESLWKLATQVCAGGVELINLDLFARCLDIYPVGVAKLTIGMFWLKPTKFLPSDSKTKAYGNSKGIRTEPKDFQTYVQWLKEMTQQFGDNYPQISHAAHLLAVEQSKKHEQRKPSNPKPGPENIPFTDNLDDAGSIVKESPPGSVPRQYWVFSPGTDAEEWDEFYSKGIMAIGWDDLQDLRQFKSQDEISQKLQELKPGDVQPTMDSLACWEFLHGIRRGDIIFVNQGRSKIIGYGIVEGEYDFDTTRSYYKNVRNVNWISKGDWEIPDGERRVHAKTLTGMTDPERIAVISRLVGLEMQAEPNSLEISLPTSAGVAYWWLNANPKIWDFRTAPIGSVQTYTSHNEAGNKRQKFKHFAAVKPGDLLIGYVTTPDNEIIAVCKITQALHGPPGKEVIEFQKLEQFAEPVTWAELQAVPALSKCEPILNNQGSLFAVTADEYDAIRALIDERNIYTQLDQPAPFTKTDALAGLFMSSDELDTILARLKRKKALILQGPPGVGKTFIARRLAFALMGKRDTRRVAMIQFHPSYGYEDFVQGFRPTRTGLERRDGVFHQFARLAKNDPNLDWFFIIDEINRGNLAKIFGELLMLIEADKRGSDHAIPLTYSEGPDETFQLPPNLHLIGTMNTADRSLAMVDYALRRRFSFVTLNPALDSPGFASWLKERNASDALIARIRSKIGNLNEIIENERDLGPGFRIGHSFFCPPDDHSPDEAWYREIIAGEIQPLLEEYFDSREKVEKLVAELLA